MVNPMGISRSLKVSSWLRKIGLLAEIESEPASIVSRNNLQPPELIPLNDPLVAYFERSPVITELNKLNFESPTLDHLRETAVELIAPLLSHGKLVGLLILNSKRSEQEYTADDRQLINLLSSQVAPAVRVAQLVKQRQTEILEKERIDHEMQVARSIQQTLLPKQPPTIAGWKFELLYQPARAVGGDFYDFFPLPDGRIVVVIGDVTDKGVPAALVMASTRAILRGTARRMMAPGEALKRGNELLLPEIPSHMFVTCLYGILDPKSGYFHFANAGHNLPVASRNGQVRELRATGMPLGLMEDMEYEENTAIIEPGECLLLYSDGLVEAHDPQGGMFGFPRLYSKMAGFDHNPMTMVDYLLSDLKSFTGDNWEQEDDVTLLTLHYQYQTPGEEK